MSFVVPDLIRLTDGIRPQVLNRVIEKTCHLVVNRFEGYPREARMVIGYEIEDTLVELAKLDGAFIERGDSLI